MTVYDTPNSTHTYTVPQDAVEVDLLIRGGPGGQGEPVGSYPGGEGGNAGEVQGTLPVSGGESLPVYVGAAGKDGTGTGPGSAVNSPVDGGVQSGAGGGGAIGGSGASGGAPSAVEHPDGTYLGLGEGGGGGGGQYDSGDSGGGGGGARGGLGGAGELDGSAGGDATGTGSGGDGGDGAAGTGGQNPGQPGGTVVHADLTDVTQTTSASSPRVEIVARYPPAAPSVSIDATRATEIDLSWTDPDGVSGTDPEDGYRVYTSVDGGSTWTQVADLAANTTSYTATGLDNGRDYHVKVEAYNNVDTASDTAGPTTTTLPDAQQPTLNNGVEDEIEATWTDVSNFGDYHVQIRETGQSAWDSTATGFAEATVGQATTSHIFGSREDGEEYEVRMRTETEDVLGNWTTPVAIVTKFPTPASLQATADSPTQATVTWTDQTDNEDGFTVERRRVWPDGPGPWTQLADLSANTESYTDGGASPEAQLEYRVTAYTEDSTAAATDTVTMPALAGTVSSPVATRGYTVEIERSDGVVRRPSVLDGVNEQPRLNGRPQIDLPLRPDLAWLDSSWEGADLRVWRDGQRLPIDEVSQIEPEPGQVTLRGTGGKDLRTRHEQDVTDKSAHDVCRDILDTTGLSYTVDPAPTDANVEIVTIDTQEEFVDALDVTADVPLEVANGQVSPLRSALITAANDISSSKLVSRTDKNWTASEAVALDVGALATTGYQIDVPYPIPASRVGVAVRIAKDYIGSVNILLDGTEIDSIASSSQDGLTVAWNDRPVNVSADLTAGTHDIDLTTDDGGFGDGPAGTAYIDSIVVYDTKYHDPANFDNTLNSNNLLDGPPGPYAAVNADFFREAALDRVTGSRLEATLSSTANEQAIGVRPSDPDLSFTTASNSSTVETDFSSDYGTLDARVTLSATDGDTGTNVTVYRTSPQSLDALTIKADLLRSASVQDRSLDNRAEILLSSICDQGDLIWELQWQGGQPHVVVTRPGQRQADVDPSLVNWKVTKDVTRKLSGAVVYGRTESVEGEAFVADINNVSLDYDHIQQGSERVYEEHSDGTETVYERGEDADYVIEYLLGNIRIVAGSSMTDGQTYQIDYREQAQAEAYNPAVSGQYPTVEELPELRTDLQCERIAEYLLRQADGPIWSATVTIPHDVGFNLVDAIDPSQIPTPPGGVGLRVEGVTNRPGEVSLQLGVGQSVEKIVDDVQGKLAETARQT